MINNIYILLTFAVSIYAISSGKYETSFFVFIHYLIIGISSYSLFSYSDKPYTLHKVYHIFTLFFFGIAPVLQYYENTRFVCEPSISSAVKTNVSFVILLTSLLFNMIYYYTYNVSSVYRFKFILLKLGKLNQFKDGFKIGTNIFLISISLFSLFMMLYINNFNVMRLMFISIINSDEGGSSFQEADKSITLLVNQFVRPMSLIVFIISQLYNKKQRVLNFVLLLIFVITCFPPALARNTTAALYLPLLLLFVPIFQKRHFFVSVMLGGVMIIFPFLDNFRRFDSSKELSIGLNYDMFTEMHFDAYMGFCRIVNSDLVTYGNQLLSSIFFFVPRSIWEQKSLSSGAFHAEELRLCFSNLSCTYLAEGYINFGYVGVFLFLCFLAWLCARLDKFYWTFKAQNSFFNIFYVLILGMLLFILRGDLMNGFAYVSGLLFSAYFVYIIVLKRLRFRFRDS